MSDPRFYRLDLVNLGDLFHPDVPFSEWCKKCQSADESGFGNNRLQDFAPDLTPLEHLERICGTLLYINLSGAGLLWLTIALICFCCGWHGTAMTFTNYIFLPMGIWLLIYCFYDRAKDSRYGIHHKNQHKYLHMKYVWPVELHPPRPSKGPLIFCIVPRGVLPLGIDYAMFDKLGAGRCNFAAPSILFKLPLVGHYLQRSGVVPANAKNIRAALARNENVGVVLDGIGGLFQATEGRQEVAYLLKRKGIVKIALEAGASLVPVYGFGHSELWTTVIDPFRLLERLSLALDMPLVPFFGLGGWPLGPTNRVPLAMVFGQPLECPQKADPSQGEIDCYHTFLLDSFKETFDKHKVLCQAGDLALRLIGTQCVCVARCMSFPLSLQCAKAQHAHSQEAHRRLESEVSVASVPRQKVRISRQRLLESAVKVMNLYSSGNALLEIEYVGEVGTGSGPTLEFYAQVAEHLRSSSPALFRQNVPAGMLFPAPWDPNWLRSADDQVAQQILERFRLLGQIVAKCIIDNRLVDIQLHPAVWRSVLGLAPLSQESLRAVDPELYSSLVNIRDMDSSKVAELCLDFTLPGYPKIELKPGGAGITVT
ncbi:unnamed protein product, partial [Durusdinium trenchii]